MLTRAPYRISGSIALLAMALVLAISPTANARDSVVAGDGSLLAARAQNVDWMTAEQAGSLDLAFAVMVPSWIPAPFSGTPSISGSGGYYSLYWVNYGGEPTFLQITGEVGGSLPAGSPADLNVELSVNASVQGYDAIHDVTSIYDNVWWVANGVLYTVSSNNMTGTDSLSLANSLIQLQPPDSLEANPPTPAPPLPTSAPEPEPLPEEQVEEPPAPAPIDEPSTGSDPSGESSVSAPDPTVASDQTNVTVDDGADPSTEEAVSDDPSPGLGGNPETSPTFSPGAEEGLLDALSGPPGTARLLNVLSGQVTLSDGTAGPPLPSGGDGTGGIRQVAIP